MTSPKPAERPVWPPSGRIICNLRAPELSATSSMLLIITAIVSSKLQAASGKEFLANLRWSSLLCFLLRRFISVRGNQSGALNHISQTPAL